MNSYDWQKALEELALADMVGQTILLNLPELKGFITKLLDIQEAHHQEELETLKNKVIEYANSQTQQDYKEVIMGAVSLIQEFKK